MMTQKTKDRGADAGNAKKGSSEGASSEDGRSQSPPPTSTPATGAGCAPPTGLKRFVTDTTQGIAGIVKAPFENMHERRQLPNGREQRRKYAPAPEEAASDAGKSSPPVVEPQAVRQEDGETTRKEENGGIVEEKGDGSTAPKEDDVSGRDKSRTTAAICATADAKIGGSIHSTKSVIVLPPIVEFLVRDSTILAVAGIVAFVLSHRHWPAIHAEGALPYPVAAAWMVVAYFMGHKRTVATDEMFAMEVQVAEERAYQAVMEREAVFREEEESIDVEDLERMVGKANASIVADLQKEEAATMGAKSKAIPRKKKKHARVFRRGLQREDERKWVGRAPRGRNVKRATTARRHSVFVMAIEAVTNKIIVFEGEDEPRIREEDLPPGFWTTLLDMPWREREDWEVSSNDIGDRLMKRLLNDPGNYSRTKVGSEDVIDPICIFRGIDAFLPDGCDSELSKRKILTDCGLGDKPMGMIHVMCPFASLVSYFELPSWVEEDGGLDEKDDDPDDVIAVKRFIKGDAEYRNKRLKIYPVFREGPMAVRMLFYPPSKQFCIWGTMLPVIWNDQKPTTTQVGQKKSLVIEACVDVVSNRLARSTAQLIGSSLKNIDMDIAVVIGTPDHQEEKEPEACIGYYRYDHVDLQTCSRLPPKSNTESIMEASTLRNTLEQVSVAA